VTLAGQDPAYAALAKPARRSLAPNDLIPLALAREARLREIVLGNQDVQRAAALLKERAAKFPDEPGEGAWAFFHGAGDPQAEPLAKALQADLPGLERSINLKLAPTSASTVFRTYWALQITGQEAKGLVVLRQCAALGVPMPFEPK
jgi:hypothetical protein